MANSSIGTTRTPFTNLSNLKLTNRIRGQIKVIPSLNINKG